MAARETSGDRLEQARRPQQQERCDVSPAGETLTRRITRAAASGCKAAGAVDESAATQTDTTAEPDLGRIDNGGQRWKSAVPVSEYLATHPDTTAEPDLQRTDNDGHRFGPSLTDQALNKSPLRPSGTAQGAKTLNPGQLPRRLFASQRIPAEGRLNSYSKPEYLLDIVEVLHGTSEWNWLKQSCFGRLFELPTRLCSLSGKLIHQFLCRSLVSAKKHEIWFVFGGYPIRFSLREFGMLTGLNCEPYPCIETVRQVQPPTAGKNSYWYDLIGKQEECTVGEILNLLKQDKELPITERMDRTRRIRLALVLLVDGILTCESSTFKVSRKVVEMVKELDIFTSYPWGRKSFEKTLEMVQVGAKNVTADALGEKLSQKSTATHGFTLALQLVILKAVPQLCKYLPEGEGNLTETALGDNQLPILKPFHNENIMDVENDSNLVVHGIIGENTSALPGNIQWDDEEKDEGVDYIYSELSAGRAFRQHDWGEFCNIYHS